MPSAVFVTAFGDPSVLELREIDMPQPHTGEVLIEVVATAVNPIESAVRRGDAPHDEEPPFRQGADVAGHVIGVGEGVGEFHIGDEVMGWAHGAHATHVLADPAHLMKRPRNLTWEAAGGLHTAGTVAWKAVEDLNLGERDTVLLTAAAGGVGCLAAQLAVRRGAKVIGTAVAERADFLRQLGVIPLDYGPDLGARVRAVAGGTVTGILDFLGDAGDAASELGVPASRTFTTLDFSAVESDRATKLEAGSIVALTRIAKLISDRAIRLPLADVFKLEDIADAYRELDRREAPGKIVLGVDLVEYSGQDVYRTGRKQQEMTLGVPTPHEPMQVTEQVPPAVGDGPTRRHLRERAAEERTAD